MCPWNSAAVLTMLLLAGACEFMGTPKASYVRVLLPNKGTVYVKYQGNEFCAASSIEGLKTAARIKLPKEESMWGAEFSMPFPDDKFPDQMIRGVCSGIEKYGDSKAGTAFLEPSADFQHAGECVVGNVEVYRMDETRREWTCCVHVRSPLGSDPEHAPAIELPAFKTLKLIVQTKPMGDKLGIGLRVYAGNAELCNVGRSIRSPASAVIPNATIRILGEASNVVATKTDRFPLLGFG